MGLGLGALLSLGTVSAAWGASNVAPQAAAQQAIEEIIVTAKRLSEPIEEIVITAKHPAKAVEARTPPVMPIEMPRLEFAVAAPPVIRL
jgi:hypothetical protein